MIEKRCKLKGFSISNKYMYILHTTPMQWYHRDVINGFETLLMSVGKYVLSSLTVSMTSFEEDKMKNNNKMR